MRKSCFHGIAISQAGIAAQTLTLMQGFEEKKKKMQRKSPLIVKYARLA